MKKETFDIIPVVIALLLAVYWLATGDKVSSDPYLLGLFRGFIWPTLIISISRKYLVR